MYELFIWNIFCVILEGFNILAAVGIRTLVDLVMTKKIGDVGDFPVKLREFKNKGFIAEQQVQFLNNTIDAGSASTHRAYRPSDTDLNILLDVAENLITTVFILPERSAKAAKSVPPRPNRKV
jgi:hypothetical protein